MTAYIEKAKFIHSVSLTMSNVSGIKSEINLGMEFHTQIQHEIISLSNFFFTMQETQIEI